MVFDYLLTSFAYKLRHFCAVTGLMRNYEDGNLEAEDCIGKSGKAEIIIQPGSENPKGGYYPDKNSIKDYIAGDKYAKPTKPENNDLLDQDVPF